MNNEIKGFILIALGGSLVVMALLIFLPANLSSDTLSFNKGPETLKLLIPGILLLVLGSKIMIKYDSGEIEQPKRRSSPS